MAELAIARPHAQEIRIANGEAEVVCTCGDSFVAPDENEAEAHEDFDRHAAEGPRRRQRREA